MAEGDSYTIPQRLEIPPKRLVSDLSTPTTPKIQQNPTKVSSNFIYRSLFVAIFIALLPLFPSQAPEFFNQTIITRSWELFHLLFVGIAVSYGLFSRRNVDAEKENQSKIDSAQSYVSKIFHVSSVFDDDEVDNLSGLDESKIHTWNSRYFRGDPMVVVAPEKSHLDADSGEKPLSLPVRSLRSRVPDPETVDLVDGIDGFSGSANGSVSKSSSSSNSPNKMRNGIREISHSGADNLEKSNDPVVLPSPIPWRSRSGRKEVKEESSAVSPPSYSLPPAASEADFDPFESHSFLSSTPQAPRSYSSGSPSPKRLSPAPSRSPELHDKSSEDSVKKKSSYRHIPPPTPPPPPPTSHKYRPIAENYTPTSNAFSSTEKTRSFGDEVKDSGRSSREDVLLSRKDSGASNSLRSEARSKLYSENYSMVRSVRTIRANEYAMDAKKGREIGGEGIDVNGRRRPKDVEAVVMERAGSRTGSNQSSPGNEKPIRRVHFSPPVSQKEKKESAEKFILVSEDSGSDGDEFHVSSDGEEVASNSVGEANEVDKKADEFIAKFREQIRLQRIESIKRASGQRSSSRSRSSR